MPGIFSYVYTRADRQLASVKGRPPSQPYNPQRQHQHQHDTAAEAAHNFGNKGI